MKIGIDLGGSHIEVGLLNEDKIIAQCEKNFVDEDRKNIRKVIVDESIRMITEILEKVNLTKSDIELIGIASPRNYFKRHYYKSKQSFFRGVLLMSGHRRSVGN